jgi:hypothetical protein
MVAETDGQTRTKVKKTKPVAPKTRTERAKDGIPKPISFFDRMAGIEKADWGTRAKLKVYRTEPFTDLVRITGQKYAMVYEEPITEERIKHDLGSGRYRLYLSFKGPADNEREIDSVEIEILDPKFPPNIPKGAWIDDPKNNKYEWAKPLLEAKWARDAEAAQQSKPAQLNNVVETVKAVRELFPEAPPPTNGVADVLNTIRAVKELSPAPQPASENGILNSIVQLVIAQNTAAQQALESAKEREQKLFMQLLDLTKKPQENNGLATFKGILSELKDIVGADTIKDLFTRGTEVVSRGRTTWLDVMAPAIPKLAEGIAPIASLLIQQQINKGMRMQPRPNAGMQPSMPAATLPASNGNGTPPQPNAAQPEQPPPLIQFLSIITFPMANHFREWIESGDEEWSGAGFATWAYDGFGQHYQGADWHAEAKKLGPLMLVAMYKQSPFWSNPQLPFAQHEQKFHEFVQSFCEWSNEPATGQPILDGDPEPAGVEVM